MNLLKRITNYPAAFMSLLLVLVTLGICVTFDGDLPPKKKHTLESLILLRDIEPLVPAKVTVLNSLVLVKHNTLDGQITGGGVLLQHHDVLFVLTSSMLFPGDVGSVSVITTADGDRYLATVIADSETLGLAALRIHWGGTLLPYELTDDPNLPVGDDVLTYLRKNPDWMIMEGSYITGTPIIRQGNVVGIVVGVNSLDENQAIVAGNHALIAFADAIVAQTSEETDDGVQEED